MSLGAKPSLALHRCIWSLGTKPLLALHSCMVHRSQVLLAPFTILPYIATLYSASSFCFHHFLVDQKLITLMILISTNASSHDVYLSSYLLVINHRLNHCLHLDDE